jgi:hypothetical protein
MLSILVRFLSLLKRLKNALTLGRKTDPKPWRRKRDIKINLTVKDVEMSPTGLYPKRVHQP